MWIRFRFAGGDPFSADCHKHCWIVWLIADGVGFTILHSKIGPVIIDFECERRTGDRAVVAEICFDCWSVINDLQMPSACEQPKVAWLLWCRGMMQKLRGIAFYDPVDIVDSQLALINQEPTCWRFAFEKRDGSFDSPNSADKGS